MTEPCDVCVVIPAYGSTPHLAAVLGAIVNGTRIPARIVVSHSGPEDPQPMLSAGFRNVTFLHSDARLFAGAARNRGAADATERILAFCDCDVLPAPDWLEQLVRCLEQSGCRFVVGSVGMARTGGYWGKTNWLCEFSELAPWRKQGQQAGGGSGNMAVYRVHFHRAGGFPEEVRTGQDTLLFHALRSLGLQQWFVPSASVGHYNQPGLPAMARHQWMHGRSFVRLRRNSRLTGWRIIRGRWLALLLPFVKTSRILWRLLEGGIQQWVTVAVYLPGLFIGMTCWGAGMLAELYSRPEFTGEPSARP